MITALFAASSLALTAFGGSGDALFAGAGAAVDFVVGIAGAVMFWCAVMELMERCGLSGRLSHILRPLLSKLFPLSSASPQVLSALSENVGANLLGLGNAATPAGIRAARGMVSLGKDAGDELCLLVVLNTASIQLIPSTIASVRAANGAVSAFDIMPAVWISSAAALAAGLGAGALLKRIWR